MSRQTRERKPPASNPYGASAYVDIDTLDLDASSDSDSSRPVKRRPGRPRKDESTPSTTRRTYASESSGNFVDPYEVITTSRGFGGMVLYNTEKSGGNVKKRPHAYFTKAELQEVAENPVKLVPVRIEFDIDNFHLSDTFMWNVNGETESSEISTKKQTEFHISLANSPLARRLVLETLVTPEHFASLLLCDISVPGPRNIPRRLTHGTAPFNQMVSFIAAQIRQQCALYVPVTSEDPEGSVMIEEPVVCRVLDGEAGSALEEEERRAVDLGSDTLRVVIRLDIVIGNTHLRDKFEYPLSPTSLKLTPETFARILAADLALDPEFIPTIAHSIREQVCAAKLQWEDDMQAPEVGRHGFRNREDDWEPVVREVTDGEVVKMTKDRDRNPRRNRRGGRRGYAVTPHAATPNFPMPMPYRPSPLNPLGQRHDRRI